jgi:hypothetical protein
MLQLSQLHCLLVFPGLPGRREPEHRRLARKLPARDGWKEDAVTSAGPAGTAVAVVVVLVVALRAT